MITTITSEINPTACDSYTSPSGNYVWSSSGTYSDTVSAVSGCDSVITVNLIVNESTNQEIAVVIEESDFPYIFGTQALTAVGKYTEIFLSQYGCDSTVILNLIVGDVISPRVRCNSINIFLDENGSYELSETDIAALSKGSTDNITAVEDLIGTASPSTFNCEDVGDEVLVSVYVTDEAGNKSSQCWVVCTVTDPNDLSFVPIENVEIEVASGICETKVEYPEISTINPCAQIELIEGLGSEGMFPLGTIAETWIAINTSGDTTEVSFDVTVSTSNDLPTISELSDISIDEDSGSVTVVLNGISYGSDCSEQGISVTAVSDNHTLISDITVYTDGDSAGSLELIITPEMSGVAQITVSVEDSEGGTISETFVVTVFPVNDPPFLVRSIDSAVVNAGHEISIQISPVLGIIFDDLDDDILTIKIMQEDGSGLPTWITIADDLYTATPTIADTGSYTFVITATDTAGATSSTKFTLIVEGYPTAIDEIETGIFEVSMFPNPTKGEVNLKINSSVINDSEVIVRSITGSELFRKKYKTTDLIKLDLSDQVSGVYLITLKQGDKFIFEKLILDRR